MPLGSAGLGKGTASRVRLSTLIDSLPVGLVLLDENCELLLTNGQLLRFLSYDSERNVVQQLNELFNVQALCDACQKSRKQLPPREIQAGDRFLQLLVTPILAGEELLGMVILVEDITEKKILERTRDEFFSVASHELRTPLTAIRGNASLILDYAAAELPADTRQMIEDVYNSSIRLIAIVNDFLDASRLELGRMQFKVEPVRLAPLLEEVVRELGITAQEKGLSLAVSPPPGNELMVLADPVRTKQVLVNLIGNAVKFTRAGSVTVTTEPQTDSVEIHVTDTGTGISPENQKLLFRKFQQAGDSILSRDMTQGTGMGLYISRLLAQGMGGTLQLERSVPGEGSTFCLTLRVASE